MAQDRMTFGNSGTAAFGLCAGGRLVPAVHVGAGKAAEREGFCCAQVGRRLHNASKGKRWAGTHRKVGTGPSLYIVFSSRLSCWIRWFFYEGGDEMESRSYSAPLASSLS